MSTHWIHPFQPDPTVPDFCKCGAHKTYPSHGTVVNELKQVIDCDAAKIRELILERNEAWGKLGAIVSILNDPTLHSTGLTIADQHKGEAPDLQQQLDAANQRIKELENNKRRRDQAFNALYADSIIAHRFIQGDGN